MRTILIPTDFSKNALHALKYAQELYKCERACFFVLHTYMDEVYGAYKTASVEDMEAQKEAKKKESEKKLDNLLQSVIGTPPNPLHSSRQEDNKRFLQDSLSKAYLSFGTSSVKNKADAIMEYIEKREVGMLVMVNSRHSFFEDMLYRSTVDLLGLKVKIPFLVMQNLNR